MTLYRIRRLHLIWGALFVFSYVFFLLALLPASFVAERLPLPKIVQLNNVQGTLWQGEIGEIRWQQQTLHHVRWKVQSTLTAGRNLPEPLRSSLSFVGKDIGNGIYKVKEEGSL